MMMLLLLLQTAWSSIRPHMETHHSQLQRSWDTALQMTGHDAVQHTGQLRWSGDDGVDTAVEAGQAAWGK